MQRLKIRLCLGTCLQSNLRIPSVLDLDKIPHIMLNLVSHTGTLYSNTANQKPVLIKKKKKQIKVWSERPIKIV